MTVIPWPSGWPHGCPRCLVGRRDMMADPAFHCTVCEGTGVPKRVRFIVKQLNESRDTLTEFDGSEPIVAALYNGREDAIVSQLVASLTECVTAVTCCLRVIAEIDAATALGRVFPNRDMAVSHELKSEGIADGFGQRARDLIARVEAEPT